MFGFKRRHAERQAELQRFNDELVYTEQRLAAIKRRSDRLGKEIEQYRQDVEHYRKG